MARGGGGGADVATDSPHAGSSVVHAKEAAAAGKPIVIGSTGLTKEQTWEIRASAETIACVLSPNMSGGGDLMFRVAGGARPEGKRGIRGPGGRRRGRAHPRVRRDRGTVRDHPPGPQSGHVRAGRREGRLVGHRGTPRPP